jgi:hypothetical protein
MEVSYIMSTKKPVDLIICDIDKTLTLLTKEQKNMPPSLMYSLETLKDLIGNKSTISYVKSLESAGNMVIFITGRSVKEKDVTRQWLNQFGFKTPIKLMCRPASVNVSLYRKSKLANSVEAWKYAGENIKRLIFLDDDKTMLLMYLKHFSKLSYVDSEGKEHPTEILGYWIVDGVVKKAYSPS